MKLYIDGHEFEARPDQSLFDIIKELGLYSGKLSSDPLVAKLAGRVFTLNYVPLRSKDVSPDRATIRKAMEASGGIVRLFRYDHPTGREAYARTAQFIVFLAFGRLYPDAVAKMSCTLGNSIYFSVNGAPDFSADALATEIRKVVEEDIPLLRRRIPIDEAVAHYTLAGQNDKVRLLKYRAKDYFTIYEHEGYADYFYGEMLPSTSFLRSWSMVEAKDGFIFVLPDPKDPDRVSVYKHMPSIFSVYSEGEKWSELMGCETLADLNELTESGKIRELVRVNEALHEKRFSQIADMICERGAKAVMLAGPSSSGKTTSANRLATQLRVHGKSPILMSLDDYYIDRDKIARGPDG